MNDIDRTMLLIKSLDPRACLEFSEYTGKWYMAARIEISDFACLAGITEHRSSPADAVMAFFEHLIRTSPDEIIVAHSGSDHRREYRWNGAAFADCTRPEVLARNAERRAS